MKNVTARGEDVVDLDLRTAAFEGEGTHLTAMMFDIGNLVGVHWNFIFLQPSRVFPAPMRFLAVRRHNHASRIMQHSKRVLDGFIIRAADRDAFAAHPVTVAILAKKHAVPEALLHSRDLRW